MQLQTLTTEKSDHVFSVGLNRARKTNAFNLQMLWDLAEAFTEYEDDDDSWCMFLFGHGDNFTGGLDLAEVGPAVASGKALFPEHSIDPLDMNTSGRRRSKPVVCAVQGWCITIGVELLLASDIRLCADDTKFSQLEVGRGIMPFGGATLRFPHMAGWGNAMRWMLTGAAFDAKEAFRMGLVAEVLAADQLHRRAFELAREVAQQAPLAVRATRHSSLVAMEQGWDQARISLLQEARKLMGTEDAAEGVRSFMERRKAEFKGR